MVRNHLTDIRCVDLAQGIFQDLVKEYHKSSPRPTTHGDLRDTVADYRMMAKMTFTAIKEFDKQFEEWYESVEDRRKNDAEGNPTSV